MRSTWLLLVAAHFGLVASACAGDLFPDARIEMQGIPRALAAGDLDSDGLPDLVVGLESPVGLGIAKNLGGGRFAAPYLAALPVAVPPVFVRIADTDGDTIRDIVAVSVAPVTGIYVIVIPVNGAGGFAPPVATHVGGVNALDVEVGDVTGDGRADVVIFSPFVQKLYVLPGSATPGGFGAMTTIVTGSAALGIGIGDFTNDGTLDIATNFATAQLIDAANGFQVYGTDLMFPYTDLEAGDFDSDGRVDLVGAGAVNNKKVRFLHNTGVLAAGQPAFDTESLTGALGNGFGRLAVGDVDADGALDFVAAPVGEDLRTTRGNGLGSFTPHDFLPGGSGVNAVVACDFDLDGKSDVATSNPTSHHVTVYLSHGSSFGPPRLASAGYDLVDVDLPDADGNGIADVVTTSFENPPAITLHRALGAGAFAAPAITAFPTFVYLTDPVVADFNADGNVDLIAGADGTLQYSTCMGIGAGAFGAAVTQPCPADTDFAFAGDFDLDGDLDVVQMPHMSGGTFFRGDGAGATTVGPGFTLQSPLQAFVAMAVADVDLDGKLDLAIVGKSQVVCVMRGTGSTGAPAFLPSITLNAALDPTPNSFAEVTGIAIGDVDEDGLPDVVGVQSNSVNVATPLGRSASVFRGLGGGAFAPAVAIPIGPKFRSESPRAALLRDLDGDGHLDLAALFASDDEVAIVRGAGTGQFAAAEFYVAGSHPNAFAAADLDGDGDVDLAFAAIEDTRLVLNHGASIAAPTLRSIHPAVVPAVGGVITLAGDRLSTVTSVQIGASQLLPSDFTIDGDGNIRLSPPVPAVLGATNVVVHSAGGTSNAKSFTFVATDPPRIVAPFIAKSNGPLRLKWGHVPGQIPFLVANGSDATFAFNGFTFLDPVVFVPLPPLDAVGAGSLTIAAAVVPQLVPIHLQLWTVAPPGVVASTLAASPPATFTVVP